MRCSEWVALIYFVYLAIVCWVCHLTLARRLLVTAASTLMIAFIGAVAHRGGAIVRDWAPLVNILAGYYFTGWLFVRPSARVEAWLIGWDRRLLGDPTTKFVRWPRFILAYLEVVYLFCFLLVPAGFLAIVTTDHTDLADRYWTMVVAAELVSFAPLAFMQSRPPWAVERAVSLPDDALHWAAWRMVRRVTIGANTFPSGHTAGSLAIALAVIGTSRLAVTAFLVLSVSIAVACVVGRYHYILDVVAGAVVALATWLAVRAAGV